MVEAFLFLFWDFIEMAKYMCEIHVNCIWSFLRTVDDASKIRMFICKNNNKNKNSSQCSTDFFIASFNIVLLSKI